MKLLVAYAIGSIFLAFGIAMVLQAIGAFFIALGICSIVYGVVDGLFIYLRRD